MTRNSSTSTPSSWTAGHHEASWRLPESDPRAALDVQHYVRLARIAEAAKFDSLFLADGPVAVGHRRVPAAGPARAAHPADRHRRRRPSGSA